MNIQQFKKKWEEKLIYADNREMINDILDEVKREVEKRTEKHKMNNLGMCDYCETLDECDKRDDLIEEISTIIDQLKLK